MLAFARGDIRLIRMRFQFTRSISRPLGKNKKAFALVLALALMGFMVLLVVTLAAIVQMQMRLTKQSLTDAKARQAAKFSAFQALNEVQLALGPDKRVSANAAMFEEQFSGLDRAEKRAEERYDWWENPLDIRRGDIEALKGTKIKESYWVGVWDTTPGNEPKQRGSYAIKRGYREDRAQYRDRYMMGAKSWLVSGNKRKNRGLTFEHLPTDTLERENSIVAVSAKSASDEGGPNTFMHEKRGVSVPLVTLKVPKDAMTGEAEGDSFETRIGWWVSDEGQKASINAIAPEEMFKIAAKSGQAFYEQQLPYYSGVHALRLPKSKQSAIDRIIGYDEESRAIIRSLDGVEDLDFIKMPAIGSNVSLGKLFFHDLTANTKGVIVNVREGGLKKDLSLGLLQRDRRNDKWTTIPWNAIPNIRPGLRIQYFPRPVGQSGYNYKSSAFAPLPDKGLSIVEKANDFKYTIYSKLSRDNAWRLPTGHIFGPQLPRNANPRMRTDSHVDRFSALDTSTIFRIWGEESFVKDPGGPLWDQLRSYYNMRVESATRMSNVKVRTRTQYDDMAGFTPVVQRFQVFFLPSLVNYGGGKYGVRLHIVPIAVLWNPYDIAIEENNYYMLHIETTDQNVMGFRMAIGYADGNYFQCLRDTLTEKLNPGGAIRLDGSPIGYGGIADPVNAEPKKVPYRPNSNYMIFPTPLFLNDVYVYFSYNPSLSIPKANRRTRGPYAPDQEVNPDRAGNASDLRFIVYDPDGIRAGEGKIFCARGIVNYFSMFPYMNMGSRPEQAYLMPFSGVSDFGALYIDAFHPEVSFMIEHGSGDGVSDNNPYILFNLNEAASAAGASVSADDLLVDIQNCNDLGVNAPFTIDFNDGKAPAGYWTRYSSSSGTSYAGTDGKYPQLTHNFGNYYRCNLHVWNMGMANPAASSTNVVWGEGVDPRWLRLNPYPRGPVMAYFKGNRSYGSYGISEIYTTGNASFPDSRTVLSGSTRDESVDGGNMMQIGGVNIYRQDQKISMGIGAGKTFFTNNFLTNNLTNYRRHARNRWTFDVQTFGTTSDGQMRRRGDGAPESIKLDNVGNIQGSSSDTSGKGGNYHYQLYNTMFGEDKYNMYGIVFMKPTAYNADSQQPLFNRKFLANNAIMATAHDFDYSPRDIKFGTAMTLDSNAQDKKLGRQLYADFAQRTKGMYGQNQAYGRDAMTSMSKFTYGGNPKANIGLDGKSGNNQEAHLIHILRDNEIINNPANLASVHLNFGPGQVRLYTDDNQTSTAATAAREWYRDYGIGSIDYLYPTYAIGNSLAPLRIVPERSFRIAWVDGPPAMQDGGMRYNWAKTSESLYDGSWNSENFHEDRNVLYDMSYHLNDILWDEYFFSTLPYRLSDEKDNFSEMESGFAIPRNPRVIYYSGADEKVRYDEIRRDAYDNNPAFGNTGFDTNAGKLMINGPFNVNSTNIDAWKTILSTHFEDEVKSYATGTKSWRDTRKTPFVRWEAPFLNDRFLDQNSYAEDNLLKGYRVLSENEIEDLAVSIVEHVKDRGPFLSMSDFVNRVVENRTTETIYHANKRNNNDSRDYMLDDPIIDPRRDRNDKETYVYRHTHMQKGILQAAIDSTTINAQFHAGRSNKFIISYDGSDNLNNGNITAPFKATSSIAKFFENPRDTWENWRAAIGPQAYGIPEYLMQLDILSKIGSFITVRSDTFKIRAYGEIRNPVTQAVEGKAWCEMTVQRVPDYVENKDAAWKITDREIEPGPNNASFGRTDLDNFVEDKDSGEYSLSNVNQKLGRRFKVVSFRWLNDNEI